MWFHIPEEVILNNFEFNKHMSREKNIRNNRVLYKLSYIMVNAFVKS